MKPQKRHKARSYVLQALYQWHITGDPAAQVLAQFNDNIKHDNTDEAYFNRLFNGVTRQQQAIDKQFKPLLDRAYTELTPIELNILRLATYELTHCHDVPYKVVINEALNLAKTFGATDDGFKYVNAVLDKIARQQRAAETETAI
ncbi:MAG: transcription antitermination factor NusB [Pseudomonadota bacterium]